MSFWRFCFELSTNSSRLRRVFIAVTGFFFKNKTTNLQGRSFLYVSVALMWTGNPCKKQKELLKYFRSKVTKEPSPNFAFDIKRI